MHSMKTVDAGCDRPVLERPDHLEPGPVADVGEPRVGVPAERSLEDPAVLRPIEDRAPGLELADPVRGLLGVELGHPGVVEELAADHRVAEVGLPPVLGVDVAQGRRDPALGHDRVGLAEQRLADEPDLRARGPASIAARRPAPPAPTTRTSTAWRLDLVDASEARATRAVRPRRGSPGR